MNMLADRYRSLSSHPAGQRAACRDRETGSSALRILLVEDNPITQLVTCQQLGELGFDPCIASFGGDALEAHREEPFDLLLLDCGLPDINGFETARTIRVREQFEGRRHVAIFALTGNTDADCMDRCLAAGMDGYLQKPVSVATLRGLVAHYLDEWGERYR